MHQPRVSSPPPGVTARVLGYVEQFYAAPISLRDVARELGYSPAYLTHIFRRDTGTPVTAWIIKRRIRAAQDLLLAPRATVEQVCERVGFSDLRYFRRQFARYVGVTPRCYREASAGAAGSRRASHSASARSCAQAAPSSANAVSSASL